MSVISDIFSRVTTGIQTQLTSISTLMVKVKNFGNRAAAYAQQKIQTLAQNLTRDPKAKEDYVRVFGLYISKKFTTISIIVLGVLGYLLIYQLIPWAEGKVWTTNLKIDTIKYTTFNGKSRVYNQNDQLIYQGNLTNGKPEGAGKQYFLNGKLKYNGNFQAGKYHGEGELFGEDGIIMYSGMFENNNYHGEGKLYNNIGKIIYVGSFEVGQRSGKGIEYDPDTMLKTYYGDWVNDVKNGYGVDYEEDGASIRYEGNFKDGSYGGEGMLYVNGVLEYSGNFANGLYNGTGNLYNLDTGALIYAGEFKDGLYDGAGILYDQNTSTILYNGTFSKGKKQGAGTSYDKLGSTEFTGDFRGDSIDYIKYLGKSPEDVTAEFGQETYKTEVDDKLIITYLGLDASVVFKIDEELGAYACEKIILGIKKEFMGLGAQSTAVERREVMGEPFSSINFSCPNYYKTVFSNLAININNTNAIPCDKYMLDKYFIRFYFNDGRTELKCIEICSL